METRRMQRWLPAMVALLTSLAGMAMALTPDGLALLEFKNGLKVTSPLLLNWNASDASPCSWGGITCTESGEVRSILLSGQNPMLEGSISSSLGTLKSLQVLELAQNAFQGSMPRELVNLPSLVTLSLSHNQIAGLLPEDFGRYMPNLTVFDIANNYFTGTLPGGLCRGAKLQRLLVGSNRLFQGGTSASLATCTSLTQARFSDNWFTSLPDNFGSISSLEFLDTSRNFLEGQLPMGLGTNSQLAYLDLSDNRLTGNLSGLEFSHLAQNLLVLNLAKNNFAGEIPPAMAMCKLLFRVDLSHNSLTGTVPPALANLSSLQEFNLQGNKLTGLHPSIYSGLATHLRSLNLAENPWNAPIAPEIGSLKILQTLNLSYGGFTGPIPSALGQLTQLEVLDLSHNDFTGEIPSALGELMISLVSVNVSFNRLTGPLPPAWVKFLVANPESFKGNPGLCLQYNSYDICVGVPLPGSREKVKLSVGIIVGVVLALATFAAFVLCWRRSAKGVSMRPATKSMGVIVKNLTSVPLPFTFEDIMAATENLSDAYIIGRGGHGVAYKALLPSGQPIMVKKIESLDITTKLVHKSFWKEIECIGYAQHRNLVRLLGFMKWGEVGLLLYDWVSNADLRAALHDRKRSELNLDWKARLRIAEGVAHGLAYLHHTYDPPIVHRDIKSSNVLLDDDLEAQISDFGLAKVLDTQSRSHPAWSSSTTPGVLGTYGYIAPEVGYGLKVTTKMDVYSYGVVLLELITGKQPADRSLGGSLHVAAWVREKVRQNEGRMSESVLDPSLLDVTNLAAKDDMLALQRIALLCTRENPGDRPAMREVVEMLKCISQRNQDGNQNGDESI